MEHDISPFLEREPTEECLAQAVVEARNILVSAKIRKHETREGVVNIAMEPIDDMIMDANHNRS